MFLQMKTLGLLVLGILCSLDSCELMLFMLLWLSPLCSTGWSPMDCCSTDSWDDRDLSSYKFRMTLQTNNNFSQKCKKIYWVLKASSMQHLCTYPLTCSSLYATSCSAMVSWCDMGDFGSVTPSGLHDNKLFGIVVWKMVNIQAQVLFQTESENFIPFEMTRFSKQFVPDLASCSLSETERNPSKVTAS